MIRSEGFGLERIDYYFIDDKSQREINSEFLEHDYNTDVITFDYSGKGIVRGEVYIAIETVRSNSTLFKTRFKAEYLRVMVHGLLHLLGYSDNTPEEKRQIREKEDFYLGILEHGRDGL